MLAYACRGRVGMSLRYNTTELALEGPRLRLWTNRITLLAMVAVSYAFLL